MSQSGSGPATVGLDDKLPSVNFADSLLRQAETWAERYAWLFLTGFSLLYLVSTLRVILHDNFWLDEIISIYCARAPVPALMAVLRGGGDLTPAGYDFALRFLPVNQIPQSVRFPSMLGVWLMALCLYFVASKLRTRLHGLVAFLFPFLTLADQYSHEGRSYGFLLGAASATFLFWVHLRESDSGRKTNLFFLWLSATAACAAHYYGVLALAPLGLGELRAWMMRRRIDWAVGLVLCAAVLPILLALPLVHTARQGGWIFWSQPSLENLRTSYESLLAPITLEACVAIAILLALNLEFEQETPKPLSAPVLTALGGYFAIPIFGVILGKFTGGFTTRYVLVALIGMGATAACVLSRRAAIVVLTVTAALTGPKLIRRLTFPAQQRPSVPAAALKSGEPIVYQGIHKFFTATYYAPSMTQSNLYYLYNKELELQRTGQNSFTWITTGLIPILPSHPVELHEFTRTHPSFVLVAADDDSQPWQLGELSREGAALRILRREGEDNIIQVTMPAQELRP